MKIIETGHIYELSNFDDPKTTQKITFISKKVKDTKTGEMELVHDGTTNEEVLEMLIDRLECLHKELPSKESIEATIHLKQALTSLKQRTLDRTNRGIEGKFIR